MLKTRLIPVLLLKNGWLVRSERFSVHQIIGDPLHEVERFNTWAVDELIYLDISENDLMSARSDLRVRPQNDILAVLDAVAARCFVPLTFGGRIKTLDDVRARIERGADRVALRTAAIESPELITESARRFGSQAVVGVIDARRIEAGEWNVVYGNGIRATSTRPAELARHLEDLGAGEILVQSVDRDGTADGYDLDLIRSVSAATRLPVIALGGVGAVEHFAPAIRDAGAAAVAAANYFHFTELSDRRAKRALARAGIDVRLDFLR